MLPIFNCWLPRSMLGLSQIKVSDLSSVALGGATGFGIRAGPSVGKPFYWSMLSLVVVKTI